MSFPSSFASQVAAIMDMLVKAAVAEITKLVEDGSVVLRLEVSRKDSEIEELKRSLNLMKIELCKAQEAVITQAAEDKQEQTLKDEEEDQQAWAVYLEPKTAESPCDRTENSPETRMMVKPEPEDEHVVQEMTDKAAAEVATNLCFEADQRDEPLWPLAACSASEENSVARQQHMQIFPSHTEQFSAPGNTESSHNSSSDAPMETAEDLLRVPIKVEVEIPPICMGGVAPECVDNEPFRHVSHRLQLSASQRPGPSLVLPPAQKSTEDHILNSSSPRAKRPMNVWRSNQKQFTCSICNKGFHRQSQLEEHKATHQPFKPFRCLKCGKSFTQKTRLNSHQSVHTGERPFSCKICGKMFSRQDNCLRHERFHSGLKPYSCGQCGKSFTVQGYLRKHQEIHLQER